MLTPEDEYPVWQGADGPVVVAPVFQLYNYSFRVPAAQTKQESLRLAYQSGVVCTDETLLHPDPYPTREPTDVLWYPEFAQWCGTSLTADWHRRFRTVVAVYGHLHIPRTTH